MGILLNGGEGGVVVVGIHLNEVSEILLIVAIFVLLVTLLRVLLHKLDIRVLPESGIVILVGCIAGGIFLAIDISEDSVLRFNPEIFFLILIPPIIFEAGYHLDKYFFFLNIRLILLYALLGTFVASVLTGVCLYAVAPLFFVEVTFWEMLAFGSLISAVDPVAVIAIFDEVHVNQTLNILVTGESVLNDAISIVLYNLFISLNTAHFNWTVPGLAISKFVYVAFGGVLVGTIMAFTCALITKYAYILPLVEPLFVAVFAILSYVVAEVFLMSGIVAIMVCGIIMSRYVELNITHKSHITIKQGMKIIASTTETIVFIYLGISTILHLVEGGGSIWDPAMIGFTLIFILVFRFMNTIIITFFENRTRLEPVSWNDQFIIAYGGLRGAIAFALAFIIETEVDARDHIITTTLVVIWFTVFILGTTIKPILKLLRVHRAQAKDRTLAYQVLPRSFENITTTMGCIAGTADGFMGWRRYWSKLDKLLLYIFVRGLHKEEKDFLRTMRKFQKGERDEKMPLGGGPMMHAHNVNLGRVAAKGATANMAETSDRDSPYDLRSSMRTFNQATTTAPRRRAFNDVSAPSDAAIFRPGRDIEEPFSLRPSVQDNADSRPFFSADEVEDLADGLVLDESDTDS